MMWSATKAARPNMQGPYHAGTFSDLPPTSSWNWERGQFERGQVYRIIKAFADADGATHPVGEKWRFLGGGFNKFDDEVILCVQFPSGEEWKISLIWREDFQARVINSWSDYIARE
jgi:hypothetical protein